MKVTTTYECEICGLKSTDKDKVAQCEAVPLEPTDIKPGDIVIIGKPGISPGYGWWQGSREWFLEDKGDPADRDHHRRATIGHPKYAVLEVVPYATYNRGSLSSGYCHRYVAVLYSPDHANREGREAYMWHDANSVTKVGDLLPGQLETFKARAAARRCAPRYGRH